MFLAIFLNVPNCLDDLSDCSKKYIISFSVCLPWMPPQDGDCEACNNHSFKPCSLYRCKSISSKCKYREDVNTGVGECYTPVPTSGDLKVESIEPPEGFEFEQGSNDWHRFTWIGKHLRGKELAQKIRQNADFDFIVETNKNASCWFTPLPEGFDSFVGGSEFSTRQNVTLSIPYLSMFVEAFVSFMGSNDIPDMMVNPQDTLPDPGYSNIADLLGDGFDDFVNMTGNMQDLVDSIIILAAAAESDKYYMFIQCMDEGGNLMDKPSYVTFMLPDPDGQEPEIALSWPPNNRVWGAGPIRFDFTATDNTASDLPCSLWLKSQAEDWHVEAAKTVQHSREDNIEVVLRPGEYEWRVECTDGFYESVSEERRLIVESPY